MIDQSHWQRTYICHVLSTHFEQLEELVVSNSGSLYTCLLWSVPFPSSSGLTELFWLYPGRHNQSPHYKLLPDPTQGNRRPQFISTTPTLYFMELGVFFLAQYLLENIFMVIVVFLNIHCIYCSFFPVWSDILELHLKDIKKQKQDGRSSSHSFKQLLLSLYK